MLLYLTLVVGVAAVGGLWPAVVSAIASGLLINWYFTPPIDTWTIAEAENVLAIVVFVFVASRGQRLGRPRRSAREPKLSGAAPRPKRSRGSPAGSPPKRIRSPRSWCSCVTRSACEAVSVLRPHEQGWVLEAAAGSEPPVEPAGGSDVIELSDGAVLVLRGDRLPAESRRVLSAFAAHLAVAVRARDLSEEAAEVAELVEVDELRTAILQAVSHDLRTPLASIKAAASSLRQDDVALERRGDRRVPRHDRGGDRSARASWWATCST